MHPPGIVISQLVSDRIGTQKSPAEGSPFLYACQRDIPATQALSARRTHRNDDMSTALKRA